MSVSSHRYSVAQTPVLSQRDLVLYVLLSAILLGASLISVLKWPFRGVYYYDPIAWAGFSVFACIIVANHIGRWALLGFMRRPSPPPPLLPVRIAAVTAIVPGTEPLAMLERSLRALVGLSVAHDSWVLDEGNDPAVRALCEHYQARHYTRKDKAEFQTGAGKFAARSKHGNYNAWLAEIGFSHYDIISAFDIDHVPSPTFLCEVLGYFNDPSIGYVQAAQAYRNQDASFVARGAAEESYEFYSVVQMANNRLGYPTVVGCHNTHRMKALASVDGFAAHDADDLLITLRYRQAGWQGVYVPRILARGVAPADWRTYLNQQRRWSRAVLDLKLRRQWAYIRHLRPLVRVAAMLHGLNYIQPGLLAILGIALLVWMLLHQSASIFLTRLDVWATGPLALTLGLCHIFRQRFFLDPMTESGVPWRAWLLRFAKWPFLLLALIDVLRDKKFSYVMTPKIPSGGGGNPLLSAHAPGLVLVAGAWIFSISRGEPVSRPALLLATMFMVITLGLILSAWTPVSSLFRPQLLDRLAEKSRQKLRVTARAAP